MFSHFSVLRSKQPPVAAAGFSLVELIVSIGIMVLVLSIVITQQGSFNSAVLLRSQAYEIALTIRDAQLSAMSAINTGGSTEDFSSVIGVHFDKASPNRYVVFIDSESGATANAFYNDGEQFGVLGIIDNRFEIIDILDTNGNSVGGPGTGQVSITFERPDFDARFRETSGGSLIQTGQYDILIQPKGSPAGSVCPLVRTVRVTATGQVSVLDCP